mmetsp:Transcript_47604/g.101161  ORF Transcript_47604/g.101161 Transcript_47604/m.101161 type:complete len:110 (+) Transcript_47604:257-586(+)
MPARNDPAPPSHFVYLSGRSLGQSASEMLIAEDSTVNILVTIAASSNSMGAKRWARSFGIFRFGRMALARFPRGYSWSANAGKELRAARGVAPARECLGGYNGGDGDAM